MHLWFDTGSPGNLILGTKIAKYSGFLVESFFSQLFTSRETANKVRRYFVELLLCDFLASTRSQYTLLFLYF